MAYFSFRATFFIIMNQNWPGPPIPILARSASIYKKFLILSSKMATVSAAPAKRARSWYCLILCCLRVVMGG